MEPEPEEARGEGMEEMEELVAKALRPSRMLSVENLLASELAAAVLSEPLGKIRYVCEALMLLTEEERQGVGITGGELKEAKKLYELATALQNAHINREMDLSLRVMIDRYAEIPWPFRQNEAAEWMGDWLGDDFHARCYHKPPDGDRKILAELPWAERVHYATSELEASMGTYKGIVIRFVNYAMPKAATLMRKIVGLVSTESYLTALKIMCGKQVRLLGYRSELVFRDGKLRRVIRRNP